MVVFNDPVRVENPALQAVMMALEMRNVIGALTEKWRRLGHEIGFGSASSTGLPRSAPSASRGARHAAIGTVANVASRLCDEAKPGQILISPRVFMAVEDAVKVEPVASLNSRAFVDPSPLTTSSPPYSKPLILSLTGFNPWPQRVANDYLYCARLVRVPSP